jgi:putative aldouronate transport system substrate-binding protein
MKGKIVRTLGLVSSMIVALAFGAYGQTKAPVTMTYLMTGAAEPKWNQLHDSPVQQELARVTGMILDFQSVNDDKFNVIIASGDLPDFVEVDTGKYLKTLVDGGAIITLDKLLATNGKDIARNVPKAISFRKNFRSFGTGNLYSIPVQVGLDADGQEASIGPTLRWDLYKDIGAPAMRSDDDLLKALGQMVQKNPKTTDGKTVYGVGIWSDWGAWPYNLLFQTIDGYYNFGSAFVKNTDPNTVLDNYSDSRSPFWKGVTFYYKANRMGIFDKDSFVQKWADFAAKCTAGQELFSLANWATGDFNRDNAMNGKGFMVIPLDYGAQWKGATMPLGWPDKDWAITKSCKTPDRAMDLINYFYSYEGIRMLYSGVKGVHWDIVGGKPQMLDSAIELRQKGGAEWESQGIFEGLANCGLGPFTINPADGLPLSLWQTPQVYSRGLNALQKSFSDFYNVPYPNAAFAAKLAAGKNTNQKGQDQLSPGIMPAPPDDIQRLAGKLEDTAVRGAVKCVLATSDSAFEAAKTQLIADLKAAGSDRYFQWYVAEWKKARGLSSKI